LVEDQRHALSGIASGARFSVHRELRALLYLGVLCLAAGVGLTIKQYFSQLGHVAVLGFLTAGFAAALAYCLRKGAPYSPEETPAPNAAFDYVLLAGCLFFALAVAYVETQFHVLGGRWKTYLLLSAVLFFGLAYRFDNRLVLSLALSTLAAWFGLQLHDLDLLFSSGMRLYALAFGTAALGLGASTHRRGVKAHFLDVYLQFAAHFLFVAMVSGVFRYRALSPYFPGLVFLCWAAALYARRTGRFVFMLYAVVYGYLGLSAVLLHALRFGGIGLLLLYFIGSSIAVVAMLFRQSRAFKGKK